MASRPPHKEDPMEILAMSIVCIIGMILLPFIAPHLF